MGLVFRLVRLGVVNYFKSEMWSVCFGFRRFERIRVDFCWFFFSVFRFFGGVFWFGWVFWVIVLGVCVEI